MASDMASMFKALLEAQEREMTWNPTSHHGFESSSTYQDELLNGNFPPVDQYGYGESYQTWIMEPAHGEVHPSPIPNEAEIYNMLQLILEGQEELNKSFREESEKLNKSLSMLSANMRDWNQGLTVAAPTHEENAEIKDEFLQEAEKTVAEFELLLGCTVDENLVIRYENPCDDGLVAECLDNERMHMQLICQQETEGAKPKEKAEIHIEEATNEVGPELSPEAQPFDKHLGTLFTHEVRSHDPWKIPSEEIRMKEFRGWFYDEYDPGDRNPSYTPL